MKNYIIELMENSGNLTAQDIVLHLVVASIIGFVIYTSYAIFGLIYYSVRMYLESDAMIKARYLSKEYMEEKKISSKKEIDEMIRQYDIVNDIGIKFVNYQLLSGILIKIIIFTILCMF